ncbi:caveolin-2 [Epinephelus fuscoguttatus]|uniref:caveolin-2 n=1 Tax=Epinephelus fuscoguttatus TaxID=293821 RepID=UPI0020D0F92F|nr:caveolin-2 [Epinephelus fuscoguttatus]
MMKGEDSEEVEIDLEDSSGSDEYDNEGEPETLWRAPPALEEEENIHTSTLVEISDTKPLINVRDPRGINDCLKVSFEDVIAEPVSVRSGDRVWIWSNALFEVSRVWVYRIFTVLLAIPVSIIAGLLFAILSCLHIWMVGPCSQCIQIGIRWLQRMWNIVLDIIVQPTLTSAGRCCGGFSIHLAKE